MAGYCAASQYVPPHNVHSIDQPLPNNFSIFSLHALCAPFFFPVIFFLTRIFHGLRKFGGYQLSRRSDINQVLRELAKEAGWVVEPDGTTYRYKVVSRCPTCGVIPNTSTNTTPTTSSTVIACGGGGDCSPTTSPRCNIDPVMINPYNNSHAEPTKLYGHEHGCADSCTGDVDNNNPLAFYMYNGPASGPHHPSTATAAIAGGGMKVQIPGQQQLQGTYIQEARAFAKGQLDQ